LRPLPSGEDNARDIWRGRQIRVQALSSLTVTR